jgi:uncharacterized protein YraI
MMSMVRGLWRLAAIALLAVGIVAASGGNGGVAGVDARSCGPCPATTTDRLNLRTGPGTNHKIILTMPANAAIEINTDYAPRNGFLRVTYKGTSGWAHGNWIAFESFTKTTTVALNLRVDPDLNAKIYLVMPKGAKVTVIGAQANGFLNVRYQGYEGWAYASYLK